MHHKGIAISEGYIPTTVDIHERCAGPEGGHATEQLRLVHALQQLGCQHLMHGYWGNTGAKSGESPHFPACSASPLHYLMGS